jgi:hypothetical protein
MKTFYYKSQDYLKRDFVEVYTRDSRWIKIDFTTAGVPFIRHNGRRYKIDNFFSLLFCSGCNTEITADDGEKVVLCGYQTDVYYKPYFIEISDGGDYARLYIYEGSKTQE